MRKDLIIRGFGILLLLSIIIAVLGRSISAAVLLGLFGLTFLLIPKKLAELSLKDFLRIKDRKTDLMTVFLLELAFWVLIILLIVGVGMLFSLMIQGLSQANFNLMDTDSLKDTISISNAFIVKFLLLLIASFVVWFFIYTITRYLSWRIVSQKKKSFWKFTIINLLLWLLFTPLILWIVLGTKKEVVPVAMMFIIPVYIFLSLFLHVSFFRSKNIKETLILNFRSIFEKFAVLIIPFMLVTSVYFALQLINFIPLTDLFARLYSIFVVVLLFSWVRFYFYYVTE